MENISKRANLEPLINTCPLKLGGDSPDPDLLVQRTIFVRSSRLLAEADLRSLCPNETLMAMALRTNIATTADESEKVHAQAIYRDFQRVPDAYNDWMN